MTNGSTDARRYLAGAVAGLAAWAFGYAVTYLVVASEVRDSALNRIIELLGGEPATHEMVGWVFFNAHFVATVFHGLPAVGSQTRNFVGTEDGFTALLYLLPVAALLAAGMALAWAAEAESAGEGAMVAVTITPGYLLACIVGVFLFEISAVGATGAPEALPAIAVAGVAYPALLATAGGALAGAGADPRPQ